VIATTGEVSKSVCNPMRMPYFPPNEIRELIADIDGRISILFGRENWGLNNEGRSGRAISSAPSPRQRISHPHLSHA